MRRNTTSLGTDSRSPYRLIVGREFHRRTVDRAFTLIELLLVVAIIVVLISLLLPALHGAREQAKQTVCLARIKGLSVGIALYATEFADFPPYIGNISSDSTFGLPLNNNFMVGFYPFVVGPAPALPANTRAASAFLCPANLEQPATDYRYSTYGLNMLFGGYAAAGGQDYCKFSALVRPAWTPLMGDRQGSINPLAYSGDMTNVSRIPHVFRHNSGNGTCVLFCDGHGEALSKAKAFSRAYQLDDYNTWRPRYRSALDLRGP